MNNILEKINKSALRFLQPLTLPAIYETILHEAIKLVKADEGVLLLWKDNNLQKVYASSPNMMDIKNRERGFSYKAFKANKSFITDSKYLAKIHPEFAAMKIKSTTYIPLSYRGKSIGVMALHSRKNNHFTQKELDILELFGSMASLAIRKTQSYDETRRALEIRNEFIALAAHELRTPLTAVHGYAELLHRKAQGSKNSLESKWTQSLYSEVIRMKDLIKELLDVNKIRTGQFEYILKECHFSDILERAIATLRFNYPETEIEFRNSVPKSEDIVIGDNDKLLQVAINLLDNAAKYSERNGKIKMLLTKKNGFLKLIIKDSGVGISEKDLPRVFEGFYKGDDNHKEGIGIGLHLCKYIVEYHQGKIAIKSKKNKGTTAELKLPGVKYAYT